LFVKIACQIVCILSKIFYNQIDISKTNDDGRINSCHDETVIRNKLYEYFAQNNMKHRIIIPSSNKRHWYDILILDYKYGWLPVNIKTTTMKTSDNIGNLALCVYAYTSVPFSLDETAKHNGQMSEILLEAFENKKCNYSQYRDYYFLVVNKNNPTEIIVNSINGLTHLTSNNNNLPFQVNWSKNKKYKYKHIRKNINMFIDTIKKPKPKWDEKFLTKIRKTNPL